MGITNTAGVSGGQIWSPSICPLISRYNTSLQTMDNKGKQATVLDARPHFYQTRSAWSVDQGSNKNHSPAYNFTPTVTKFCVMWEGLSLPHDTKFGNCRCKIVDSRSFHSWSLIHGLRWSGLIKVGPGHQGWNDLHSLCRIGMEYYLLNIDDNNIIYWIMMMIMIMMMMTIMMTMMIIGTATIMIMIIIITTTLTMTIMKMIMIKTAQTPCQSLYKDRRI